MQKIINKAYRQLLPKDGQTSAIAPQFFCHLLNISECVAIEQQNRVNCIVIVSFLSVFYIRIVYFDIMESNYSSSHSFCSSTSHK